MVNESGIAYQNKDVISKHFGEHLREKSLRVYGFSEIPKIVDVRPTNLPVVEANELRIDNLFVFEDGTIGIIDYESSYKTQNAVKYLGYAARVVKRWFDDSGSLPRLRILIIYTADVTPGSTPGRYDLGGLTFDLQEAFLTNIDGDRIYADIDRKIVNHEELTDEDIMRLVILPLTYRDDTRKQEALSDAVQLAGAIEDMGIRTMALAGILTFSDKVIGEREAEIIRRRIAMTKIEAIIEREKEEAVRKKAEEVTFNLIFDLFNSGDINREAAMARVGLSDDEFGKRFEEYKLAHAAG